MEHRLPGLDGMRAFAVLAVMAYHADASLTPGGFVGVDIFFVLSGFLITNLLNRELDLDGSINLRAFYTRRVRRLLPALGVLLLVCTVVTGTFIRDAAYQVRSDLIPALTFSLNWTYIAQAHSYFFTMARPPLLQHLWSLAIEEQFYIVWPLALLAIMRVSHSPQQRRRRIAVIATLAAVASTIRMTTMSIAGNVPAAADPTREYFGTDTHAMGLLIGCALAAVWPTISTRVLLVGQQLRHRVAATAVLFVLLSVGFGNDTSSWLYRGGFLAVSLATAVLIVDVAHEGSLLARIVDHRYAVWIGRRSYAMYLWHWPVFMVTRPEVDWDSPWLGSLVIRFAVVIGLAHLSYTYVEAPILAGRFPEIVQTIRSYRPQASLRTAVIAVAAAVLASTTVSGMACAISPEQQGLDALGGVTQINDQPAATLRPDNELKHSQYSKTVVFGDSVVLSGKLALQKALSNLAFDAAVSRQPWDIAAHITHRRQSGALGPDVVIHMGTNGIVRKQDLQPILELLRDRRRVVMVNVQVPRKWMNPSNRVIAELIVNYPNVRLADWYSAAHNHREYFVRDRVHLNARGGKVFAQLVSDALQAQ